MEPLNLQQYEAAAREKLPQMVFDYIAGGADDEITLADNRRAWQRGGCGRGCWSTSAAATWRRPSWRRRSPCRC